MAKRFKLSKRDYAMAAGGACMALGIFGLIGLLQIRPTPLAYQKSGITAAWIPLTVKRWDTQINAAAKQYDIDANLIAILTTMESGGNPKAKSEVGATGLMQIMPLTAQDIAAKYLKQAIKDYNLSDPATNVEFGAAYLAMLRDEFGTVELIAAGYNGGPGTANALEQGEGLRDTQPVVYSRDALNMWRERVSPTSPTYDRWKERGGNDLLKSAEKN